MRILYVVPEEFDGKRWGGVSSYTISIAQAMTKRGHEVRILTPGNSFQCSTRYDTTICTLPAIVRTRFLRLILWPIRICMPHVHAYIAWGLSVRWFVKYYWIPDIAEMPEWGASALFLPFSYRPRIVVRLHRSWYQYVCDNNLPVSLQDRIINIFEIISAWCASAVSSPTIFMRSRYRAMSAYFALRRAPFRVIANAVAPWRPFRGKRVLSYPYVLTVGRIEVGKGSVLLADAFLGILRRFPHIRLVYLGEDTTMFIRGRWRSCQEYILEKYRKANREWNVVFTGKKAHKEIAAYYWGCMFYVAPSRGHENPSLALLEALRAGKAVVASRTGGIPEIVTHGKNGLLFDVDQVYALQSAIIRLITDHRLRMRLARSSRYNASSFDLFCQQTERLYKSIV